MRVDAYFYIVFAEHKYNANVFPFCLYMTHIGSGDSPNKLLIEQFTHHNINIENLIYNHNV